jgi:nitroreductase
MKDINQIIRERRSIFPKEFTGKKVDDDIIHQLLENAQWAPSHRSTFAWRFMVYTGDAKNKLFDYWLTHAKEEKIEKITLNKNRTSHVIILVVQDKKINPYQEEVSSVACAVQNIYLSLTQYPNVGGYWGSGNGTYTDEFAQFLKLSSTESCMGYFLIGDVENKRTAASRPPVENNVIWVK